MGGKRPDARDEAHGVLAGRRGVGDTMEGSRGKGGRV